MDYESKDEKPKFIRKINPDDDKILTG